MIRPRRASRSLLLAALSLAAVAVLSAQNASTAPEIPLVPGLTFVLAVHNPSAAPAGNSIAVGDYEMVVGVSEVAADHIVLATKIEAEDERKQQLMLDIERRI